MIQRCWHSNDIEAARFIVRFRAVFGHQREVAYVTQLTAR
jgi:hypothetical protein